MTLGEVNCTFIVLLLSKRKREIPYLQRVWRPCIWCTLAEYWYRQTIFRWGTYFATVLHVDYMTWISLLGIEYILNRLSLEADTRHGQSRKRNAGTVRAAVHPLSRYSPQPHRVQGRIIRQYVDIPRQTSAARTQKSPTTKL